MANFLTSCGTTEFYESDGDSAPKKSRSQHLVLPKKKCFKFTGLEKELLEEQYKSGKLNEKSREVVAVLTN